MSGAAGAASAAPLETRINAEYTWLIRAGISALDTVLLLTSADTMLAVSWIQRVSSVWSAIVGLMLKGPSGVVVSVLVFPRQLIKRRLIATSAIAIFCHVEFLMLVVFHAGTVLRAPAISFSVDAVRFHSDRISGTAPGRHTCQTGLAAQFEI